MACVDDCDWQRGRDCTEPEPRHGGRPCEGPTLGADNCTGGLCIQRGDVGQRGEHLLEAKRCHLLLGSPGLYALVGQPLSQEADKRLRLAVFSSPDAGNPLGYNLQVYCVDDTPHTLQGNPLTLDERAKHCSLDKDYSVTPFGVY
ncbi:hypothetical protein NHX12_028109 [Muraenolepis orangiensis]|uniref:UPA domain-containing protein n=1 Tax=Muraenolepis orangiensis TaxID=630683 RepID=A0A9Q0EFY9_9TELE|nr:hypothetical protein NHX12_028109 [Muraenolepis orangiensis]